MKGIKINFNESGATLSLNEIVEDFNAINQDALVNLGTLPGTDKVNTERGSNLENLTIRGSSVFNLNSAVHAANISATETVDYIQNTEDILETEELLVMNLQPINFSINGLKINAQTISSNGEQIGINAELI